MFQPTLFACALLTAASSGPAHAYWDISGRLGPKKQSILNPYTPSLHIKVWTATHRLTNDPAEPACEPGDISLNIASSAPNEFLVDIPPQAALIEIELQGGGLTCAQAGATLLAKARAALFALDQAGIKAVNLVLGRPQISWRAFREHRWLGYWGSRVILLRAPLDTLPALMKTIRKLGTADARHVLFRSANDNDKAITPEAAALRQRREPSDSNSEPASCSPLLFDAVPDIFVPTPTHPNRTLENHCP